MNPFNYQRVTTPEEAIIAVVSQGAAFLGGGTNLVDLMKGGIEQPTKLIDVTHLNLTKITMSASGTTLIEAGVRNSAVANHEVIPLSASLPSDRKRQLHPQLRNTGDGRRKSAPADALPVFHGSVLSFLQQAHAGQRMCRDRRFKPRACNPWHE